MVQDNQLMFDLIRSEILGCSLETNITEISFDRFRTLYEVSKKHDISQLIYIAIKRNHLLPIAETTSDKQYLQDCTQSYYYSVYRSSKLASERQNISKTLSRAKIKHLFLKGAILRDLYPQKWMRTSGDIDCLVQEDKLFDAVDALRDAGYVSDGEKHFHDIELDKADVHLELHFNICEDRFSLDQVLKSVWNNIEETSECEMKETPEFFIFHHIAHMAYHISTGGCGIRPFVDLWVMTMCLPDNKETTRRLCERAGIDKFYDLVNRMVCVWFENGNHDQETLSFEKYIIASSLFGTKDSKQNVSTIRKNLTKHNIAQHLFLSYDQMKEKYPSLKKWPFLLPVYELYRLVEKLVKKNQRQYFCSVLQASENDMDIETLEVMRFSGLDILLK